MGLYVLPLVVGQIEDTTVRFAIKTAIAFVTLLDVPIAIFQQPLNRKSVFMLLTD